MAAAVVENKINLNSVSDEWDTRFLITNKSYMPQFSQIYFQRLIRLKPIVLKACQTKWGNQNAIYVPRLLDVQEGVLSYIIGTIYMDMVMKPNILREVIEDIIPDTSATSMQYTDPSDKILLEDESGRVILDIGDRTHWLQKNFLFVTGIVIGILGQESPSGEFIVHDICFSEVSQNKRLLPLSMDASYIAVISGIDNSTANPENALRLSLALEAICDFQQNGKNITSLIIAGNSIQHCERTTNKMMLDLGISRSLSSNAISDSIKKRLLNARTLDELISFTLKDNKIKIFWLPGCTDPTNTALPQQPFHASMFPTVVSSLPNVTFTTNPAILYIASGSVDKPPLNILVTSGETINDLAKYNVPGCLRIDSLQLAEMTLRWRHLAPTAPDTLWCYPFYDRDPFLLDESITKFPDIYIIGNQGSNYDFRYIYSDADYPSEEKLQEIPSNVQSLLVSVPSFSVSPSMVLINSNTLECQLLTIDL